MGAVDYSHLTEKLKIINEIPIFAGVGLAEQRLLADKFYLTQAQKGEIVIEQGAAGDKLYALIEGRILVMRKSVSRGWYRVNTLGPGDIFGEIAILRKIPRTARIITETPCVFMTISARDFLDIYQYFPKQSRDNIQLIVAKRLAQLNDEDFIGRVHTTLR